MKRWLSFVAIVVLGLALVIGAACGGGEEEEEGVTELKFGIGLPLTGAYGAAVGLPCKYGYSMGAEKIGEFTVGGEQYRWKLIFEDNLFSVAGGTAAATKFIYEDHVQFMDQVGADSGLAALPICEELGMILITSTCDFDDFRPDRPHFFQTSATWSIHVPVFFDWLTAEHPEVHTVAYVGYDDRTGHSLGDALVACADYYGFEMVAEDYIPMGTVEHMPIATKIASTNPDLYISSIAGGVEDIYGTMVAMGYEGLGASYYWTEAGAERIGWDVCEGYLLFLPFPVGDVWPEVTAFRAEYDDRYGIEFAPSAFWAANMAYVMTRVLEQAGTVDDVDKIIETMETESFDTLVGLIGYGLEELNGIGHLAIYPTPIMQVVGEEQYELLAYYTPEETEAIAVEVLK
jgi:ABC-type branched-subunit amino acid transport system substrate-binding protein